MPVDPALLAILETLKYEKICLACWTDIIGAWLPELLSLLFSVSFEPLILLFIVIIELGISQNGGCSKIPKRLYLAILSSIAHF